MPVTVALIDDDSRVRWRLKQLFESLNLRVVEYDTEVHRIEQLMDEDVDAFVVDIVMPNVDGIELLRRMRHVRRGTPVVAYSNAYPEYVPYAEKLGATAAVALQQPSGEQVLAETTRRSVRQAD